MNRQFDTSPTAETYEALQFAYSHMNDQLFEGRLPSCLMVLSRKKANNCGHYINDVWSKSDDAEASVDEIALNANALRIMPLGEILQTIAHEMCHLEQQHFGKPSRNGYHNKEWGTLMDRIGLTPSNTGQPGGKRTGQQMADYAEPDGAFEAVCAGLIESGFVIPWLSIDTTRSAKPATNSKTKFECPCCDAKAWGKPELNIRCGDCDQRMTSEGE